MIEQGHIDKKATFEWMKGTGLKGGTEETIVAIQEQAVTTRYIKKHIHKTTYTDICRMCNTMPETITHVVSGCTTLAATSYLKRHNSGRAARYNMRYRFWHCITHSTDVSICGLMDVFLYISGCNCLFLYRYNRCFSSAFQSCSFHPFKGCFLSM